MDIVGFILSILPLLVVLLGIVWLKKSALIMVFVGLALTALLCWAYFKTDPGIVVGGIIYGIVKSFGISIAVIIAMFMVFLMQITGSLKRISDAVHNIAGTKTEKALFVGMGFGSFVTALGLVAPTLFPPLLVAMGFSPLAAVTVACLGYDPLCSFALLSLPITAPVASANAMGIAITVHQFAMNIAIFLPVISVGFAFAILWVVGKMEAIKSSWFPALMSGLVISLSALVLINWNLVPISIVGVIAGALSMASLFTYNSVKYSIAKGAAAQQAADVGKPKPAGTTVLRLLGMWVCIAVILIILVAVFTVNFSIAPADLTLLVLSPVLLLIVAIIVYKLYAALASGGKMKPAADGGTENKSTMSLLRSLSPWIILIFLVSVAGIPQVTAYLLSLPGNLQVWTIPGLGGETINLECLTQAYTWIFVASILGIFTLGATWSQVTKAFDTTVRRLAGPFLTYSLFFSIAYLMFFCGGTIIKGAFTPGAFANPSMNMDAIIGLSLAAIFGGSYSLAAPIPGLIGSVIGGSETSSNVMFAKIQSVAVANTIGADKFGVAYGSLAVAGGVGSAITPAKINNACATLGEGGKMESQAMATNMWVAIGLTVVTCVMLVIFLALGIGF